MSLAYLPRLARLAVELLFFLTETSINCVRLRALQFGFKAKHSTTQCSIVPTEATAYFVNNGSTVYCSMLNATKAFDRVEYCKLFRLLASRYLPHACLRTLVCILCY